MARPTTPLRRRSTRLAGLKSLVAAVSAASAAGGPSLSMRLGALPRLAREVRSGSYRGASTTQLAMLTAAAAYVASPVDLLPEALLGVVGLADDAAVLSWLASTLVRVTDDFLDWEKRTGVTLSGERVK